MADIYGEENVLTERYRRDVDGKIVKDPDTGERRRLDCVVVDGQCGYATEITSPTADKQLQIGKERRIREEGGIYVKNPNTGKLIEIENISEVIRLE